MQAFDAHNHLQKGGTTPPNFACAPSATCEADWKVLEEMANGSPLQIFPGYGIHPWWAGTETPGWEERLKDLLAKNYGAFIGESGLDGYRATRVRGPGFTSQISILRPQLRLAKTLDRPIVLHCVRAWDELRECLQEESVRHFAIHRFKGSPEMASEIMQLGGYISVHLDTLYNRSSSNSIKWMPRSRILVETDWDGPRVEGRPMEEEIGEVLRQLAVIWDMTVEATARATLRNAKEFYRIL
jgi:TatD DNase family protein